MKIHQTLDTLVYGGKMTGHINKGRPNIHWEKYAEDWMGGKCMETRTNSSRSSDIISIKAATSGYLPNYTGL